MQVSVCRSVLGQKARDGMMDSERGEVESSDIAGDDIASSAGKMRSTAISGGRWTLIENVVVQVMSLLVTLVLARVLLQSDYGAIAAVTVAAGFLTLLGNIGFSVSLIQRKEVTDERVSSIFWAGAGLGTLLAIAFALASPLIAASMRQPEITPMLVLVSTQVVTAILSTIPEAVLLRRFKFKTAALVSMGSFVVYPPVAIGLAIFFDAGAWAVVIGQALRPLTKVLLGMYAARWRPKLTLKWELIREDFGLNAGFFVISAAGFLTKNLDYWLISRHLGDRLLGIYYMAFVIPTMIRQRLTWALGRVLIPVLSRVRDDQERFRRVFLDTSRLIALTALPALIGLALVAKPMVQVVLSENWIDAAAPLPLLALTAAADSLSQVTLRSFVAYGKPMRALYFSGPRLIALVVGVYMAVEMDGSLVSVSWAVLASSILNLVLAHCVAVWKLDVPFGSILRAYRPVFLPLVAMIVAARAATVGMQNLGAIPLVELFVGVTVGAITYVGAGASLSRSAFVGLLADAKSFLGKGPKSESGKRREE